MSIVFLGIGSNIDAEKNIRSAMDCLRKQFDPIVFSPLYRCAPHGFEGADFLNLVARIETRLAPLDLKHWLTQLENRHARRRDVPKFSSRTLDVDILLYDDLYLLSPELEIPREEILEAAYVLKPLADLAPDCRHPVARRPIGELWAAFTDTGNPIQRTVLKDD